MFRKMLGVFTAVSAGLLFVGVAWATSDSAGSSSSSTTDVSVTSSAAESLTSSSTSGSVTSTSSGPATSSTSSTSDTTVTTSASTTSTSAASTTSTSTGSSTATTDDDDEELEAGLEIGVSTHLMSGVGSVTVEVTADGRLALVSWTAPGWTLERQRVESDRVELKWALGDAEAEFEARLDNGRIEVEIEHDSD